MNAPHRNTCRSVSVFLALGSTYLLVAASASAQQVQRGAPQNDRVPAQNREMSPTPTPTTPPTEEACVRLVRQTYQETVGRSVNGYFLARRVEECIQSSLEATRQGIVEWAQNNGRICVTAFFENLERIMGASTTTYVNSDNFINQCTTTSVQDMLASMQRRADEERNTRTQQDLYTNASSRAVQMEGSYGLVCAVSQTSDDRPRLYYIPDQVRARAVRAGTLNLLEVCPEQTQLEIIRIPRRGSWGTVGLGVGLQLNLNSTAGVSPGVNASGYARHFGIDEGSWRNTEQQTDTYNRTYYHGYTRLMGLAEGQVTYNAAGYNSSQDRYTTSASVRVNVLLGGQNITSGRACGVYGGAHAIGQASGHINLPGSSNLQLRLGPETGIICRHDSGLVFMITPSVGYYLARQFMGDGTGRAIDTAGVTGGVVTRLSVAQRLFLQAMGSGTIHREAGTHDLRQVQISAGTVVLNGEWELVGFLNLNQYYGGDGSGGLDRNYVAMDATLNVINRF